MLQEKIVCSYIRLSEEDYKKDKEAMSKSITNQISYIENYAKNMGLIISKNYIDDGYTGINYNRPAFEEMLEDIKQNKIGTIITKDFSRLGREYIETGFYITKFFPENDIRYIAINENYDSNSPDTMYNDIMIGFKSIMNDRYIKDASVKIKEIKRMKTQKGYYMGFIAPYGYVKEYANDKITLRIDEFASKIVKRIFEEIASGKSRKELAEKLNEEGILSPMQYLKMTKSRNKNYFDEWSDKIIYRIIRNHTYTGDNVIRKSVKPNYKQPKRNYVAIRDREIMEKTHPAIISQVLFDEANSKIRQIKRKENRIKDYKGILNGLVICGECGEPMSITGRLRESGNIHYSFFCKNKAKKHNGCENNKKISDKILQKIVYNSLKDIIDHFVNRKNVMDKVSENISKKDELKNKIKNIESAIQSYNNKVRNLYIKKTRDEISLEEFLKLKDLENKKRESLEKELEQLIEQRNITLKREELEKKYSEMMTEENIYKYAFKDLIKEIVFNKDRSIDIRFNFEIMPNYKLQLDLKEKGCIK